jgi:hypothetical protein
MASRAQVRASDADRERVADRLKEAATEGRLLTEELEQRLEAALSARTYGQLNALLADLPGRGLTAPAEARRVVRLRPLLAFPILIVVTLALIAVVFVITGVVAMWLLWLAAGWWFLGHRGHRLHGARSVRSLHACGCWHRGRGRTRSFWV